MYLALKSFLEMPWLRVPLRNNSASFESSALDHLSCKQKLNTRSSTEAELVGANDVAAMILWTSSSHRHNILYQDNKSAILLETNGKKSFSKRTRALNIRYFFLADQVAKDNLDIEYMSTTEMYGD
jgi:hypothetical protein